MIQKYWLDREGKRHFRKPFIPWYKTCWDCDKKPDVVYMKDAWHLESVWCWKHDPKKQFTKKPTNPKYRLALKCMLYAIEPEYYD